MSDKYNGWSNYATWRVNLEVFDGFNVQELDEASYANPDIYQMSLRLKNYAESIIFDAPYDERGRSNLMEDYARAFLADVNWQEIANNLMEDHYRENSMVDEDGNELAY